jgi:hypothetical protein
VNHHDAAPVADRKKSEGVGLAGHDPRQDEARRPDEDEEAGEKGDHYILCGTTQVAVADAELPASSVALAVIV